MSRKPPTMTPAEIDDKVNRLLHDAEHAKSGSEFAFRIGHNEISEELDQKFRRLLAEANRIDPHHKSRWWKEGEIL